jgi:DUF971 family protein
MKEIQLTQGYTAQVDDKHYDRTIVGPNWHTHVHLNKDGSVKRMYAYRHVYVDGKPHLQQMHRFIKGITDPKIKVDHKDGNGLNNQEDNLRVASNAQNIRNAGLSVKNTSGYKGVSWSESEGKWRVRIKFNDVEHFLGYFPEDQLLAARDAYDAAAIKYHGEFACTNAMIASRSELPKATGTTQQRLNSNSTSKFLGVSLTPWGCRAQIDVNGERVYLGSFSLDNIVAAARARDAAAIKYFGENAKTNVSLGLLPQIEEDNNVREIAA